MGFNFDSIKEREGVTNISFCQRTAWLLVNRESSFMTMHTRSGLMTEHDSHTSLFLFLPMMLTTTITPLSSLLRLLVTFESVSAYCWLTYMPWTERQVRSRRTGPSKSREFIICSVLLCVHYPIAITPIQSVKVFVICQLHKFNVYFEYWKKTLNVLGCSPALISQCVDSVVPVLQKSIAFYPWNQ